MKPWFLKPARLVIGLGLPVLAFAPRVASQTSTSLDIQLYAGLHITGEVGAIRTIQYAHQLMDSAHWRWLAFVQLTNSPQLYVDTTIPARVLRDLRIGLVAGGYSAESLRRFRPAPSSGVDDLFSCHRAQDFP